MKGINEMAETAQDQAPWHSWDEAQVFQKLKATPDGLSSEDAQQRLEEFGPNSLPEQQPPSLWQIVLRQFVSPLIYILVLAAIVSVAMGDVKDAIFIGVVLAINTVIGAYQEWKAEQSSQALRKMLQIRAAVSRDGEVRDLVAEEVVPGDLVWLESGNRVPADLRILVSQGLEIDESFLTGESLPSSKESGWKGAEDASVGDRANMAFAGSIITRGRGQGLTVATGTATHVGQLALDVTSAPAANSPLIERMERFSNILAIATLVIAVAIGIVGFTFGRYPLGEMFMFVVALAVAAIPEGLPVAMTVALAIATNRMARRGVVVRRLTAVEGLGSCTLIATDKTGTLTVNELTIREVRLPDGAAFQVTGEGFEPNGEVRVDNAPIRDGHKQKLELLVRAGVLCNEADLHQHDGKWESRGDAVDIAMLTFAQKAGWEWPALQEKFPQVHEIPFESEHQFAATYHQVEGQHRVFVKGAPERILEMCGNVSDPQGLEKLALDMASRGLRVLALAEGNGGTNPQQHEGHQHLKGLDFLGFVGMIDPLRAGVKEAIQACHDSGVQVAMVTGDHRVTALAISRDLGLAEDESQVLTGPELSNKSPEDMEEIVNRIRVFARVAPRQKLEIVEAAQRAGHYVAVTGDGVNDAPALRAANIGVSMGQKGTDVAREASELVISDDNFATIIAGIEEGRIAYDNIRKVIFLLLSTGAAELLMVLLTVCSGLAIPLRTVQLLWLNLVTNGIQGVAIAFEPGEGDTLQRKPRPPQEPVFNQLMIERMILSVAVMGGVSFGLFYWMEATGGDLAASRNAVLLVMVLFENFHIGNCRSETKSAFALSPFRSPILMFGALGAFLVHVAAMYIPLLQNTLGTHPVSWQMWLLVIGLAASVIPIMELHKLSWNWRQKGKD